MCSSAAGGFQALSSAGSRLGVSGLVLGSGSVLVYSAATTSQQQRGEVAATEGSWLVEQLTAGPGVQPLEPPSRMLRSHPIAKNFVEKDALFETMRSTSQIQEFKCFYEPDKKQFHSVVQLGRDVCGYPQTVHGGLTAAIVDETFGGLGICCWRSGALGFRLPAYTARLEVDYKKKIPAGALLLCTAEVEQVQGCKVYMNARVSDGKGGVYATARALFVAPRLPGEGVAESIRGWFRRRG